MFHKLGAALVPPASIVICMAMAQAQPSPGVYVDEEGFVKSRIKGTQSQLKTVARPRLKATYPSELTPPVSSNVFRTGSNRSMRLRWAQEIAAKNVGLTILDDGTENIGFQIDWDKFAFTLIPQEPLNVIRSVTIQSLDEIGGEATAPPAAFNDTLWNCGETEVIVDLETTNSQEQTVTNRETSSRERVDVTSVHVTVSGGVSSGPAGGGNASASVEAQFTKTITERFETSRELVQKTATARARNFKTPVPSYSSTQTGAVHSTTVRRYKASGRAVLDTNLYVHAPPVIANRYIGRWSEFALAEDVRSFDLTALVVVTSVNVDWTVANPTTYGDQTKCIAAQKAEKK